MGGGTGPHWDCTADSYWAFSSINSCDKAFDGDDDTFWFSGVDDQDPLPHYIDIDLGNVYSITGLTMLPRQDTGSRTNIAPGNIGRYTITFAQNSVGTLGTSSGGNNPSATLSGTWPDNQDRKTAFLRENGQTTFPARYVRLTGLTEAGNRGLWTSVAQIDIYADLTVVPLISQDTSSDDSYNSAYSYDDSYTAATATTTVQQYSTLRTSSARQEVQTPDTADEEDTADEPDTADEDDSNDAPVAPATDSDTTASPATESSSSSISSKANGLSLRDKLGLGIGLGLGLMFCALIAFWLVRYFRSKRTPKPQPPELYHDMTDHHRRPPSRGVVGEVTKGFK
ncbi:MAG: hypothetical protein Q9169_000017 [Polycauliona sp. 2 TL-2023]